MFVVRNKQAPWKHCAPLQWPSASAGWVQERCTLPLGMEPEIFSDFGAKECILRPFSLVFFAYLPLLNVTKHILSELHLFIQNSSWYYVVHSDAIFWGFFPSNLYLLKLNYWALPCQMTALHSQMTALQLSKMFLSCEAQLPLPRAPFRMHKGNFFV